jgi:hypothetical protein
MKSTIRLPKTLLMQEQVGKRDKGSVVRKGANENKK